MNEPTLLDAQDLENLHHAIETAMSIRRRHQFFLWVQGALQRFLPHEVLLCALIEPNRGDMLIECFASAGVASAAGEATEAQFTGVVARALAAWQSNGGVPYLACPVGDPEAFRHLAPAVRASRLDNIAAHGACDANGEPRSFFCFAQIPGAVTARHAYFLELLIPHLHLALLRMLSSERQPENDAIGGNQLITQRESEILRWVQEGKTNHEIGQILNISPLTVKNHLQKILKKLNVQNRAQAVAKVLRLNLLA